MKKVVLAFSGGLDTSFSVYLQQDLGYEVHAVTVNTGGFNADEVEKLREKRCYLVLKLLHV
jgi:argininosuccinate synthase